MDSHGLILTEINKGYSMSDLEFLIGLPKNNLSSILAGKRSFSKKSMLKIKRWVGSENKPDPLTFKRNERLPTFVNDEAIKNSGSLIPPVKSKEIPFIKKMDTLPKDEGKHQLWKQGDPKEGSGSFILKYGVAYYNQIK